MIIGMVKTLINNDCVLNIRGLECSSTFPAIFLRMQVNVGKGIDTAVFISNGKTAVVRQFPATPFPNQSPRD